MVSNMQKKCLINANLTKNYDIAKDNQLIKEIGEAELLTGNRSTSPKQVYLSNIGLIGPIPNIQLFYSDFFAVYDVDTCRELVAVCTDLDTLEVVDIVEAAVGRYCGYAILAC